MPFPVVWCGLAGLLTMGRDSSSKSKHLYLLVNGKKSGDEGLRAAIKSIRCSRSEHHIEQSQSRVWLHLTGLAAERRGTRYQ